MIAIQEQEKICDIGGAVKGVKEIGWKIPNKSPLQKEHNEIKAATEGYSNHIAPSYCVLFKQLYYWCFSQLTYSNFEDDKSS